MTVLEYIARVISITGAAVIVWGVLRGLAALLMAEFHRFRANAEKVAESEEKVRLSIGYNLILGLEFLIAADIINTIIEPTLEELGILGAIVAIRIVLAYFLGREIGLPGGRRL
jgi:uncharacterized membrane protein